MASFVTIRHLEDQNALLSCGQDGHLVPGQESHAIKMAKEIMKVYLDGQFRGIRVLYTSKTRRIRETAQMVLSNLYQMGVKEAPKVHDSRLEVMDQGTLSLPNGYQDGEWFQPLKDAWDIFDEEAYTYRHLDYHFGDSKNGKYPILAEVFSRVGGTMGEVLRRKYSLIKELARKRDNGILTLVFSQSDLPLLIMELEYLCKQGFNDPGELPYASWDAYKNSIEAKMQSIPNGEAGNLDVPYGFVCPFDLGYFVETGFDVVIAKAIECLTYGGR